MRDEGGRMYDKVVKQLREIESVENVRVFYACESGSRAWGFPSIDSDYDIRFLYAHPPDWYLAIDMETKRDVIERPVNGGLDISGWDLRKALKLYRKSNPPLLEWLGSPIVYQEEYSIARNMRDLATSYYSPSACMYHYYHMALGNYREYLQKERVWLKKYFYVLRPILAIKWLEAGLGMVPMEFKILVHRLVDGELKEEIEKLVFLKKAGHELAYGERIGIISNFLKDEFSRLEQVKFEGRVVNYEIDVLNDLFREGLVEIWDGVGECKGW